MTKLTVFSQHTCKDGSSLLICEMSDSHLENTVKLYCRNIDELLQVINFRSSDVGKATVSNLINKTPDLEQLKKEATYKIERIMEILPAYCMEVLRRGNSLSSTITETLERTIPKANDPSSRVLNIPAILSKESYLIDEELDELLELEALESGKSNKNSFASWSSYYDEHDHDIGMFS